MDRETYYKLQYLKINDDIKYHRGSKHRCSNCLAYHTSVAKNFQRSDLNAFVDKHTSEIKDRSKIAYMYNTNNCNYFRFIYKPNHYGWSSLTRSTTMYTCPALDIILTARLMLNELDSLGTLQI